MILITAWILLKKNYFLLSQKRKNTLTINIFFPLCFIITILFFTTWFDIKNNVVVFFCKIVFLEMKYSYLLRFPCRVFLSFCYFSDLKNGNNDWTETRGGIWIFWNIFHPAWSSSAFWQRKVCIWALGWFWANFFAHFILVPLNTVHLLLDKA